MLPFANLSGDPSQDYFSDGITENLTTVSRIRDSFVTRAIPLSPSRARILTLKRSASNLAVRYILEGSVQRDENRVRVNAQLVDGETGGAPLADRFEEVVTDLFKPVG